MCPGSSKRLRSYPVAFGLQILRLVPLFCKSAQGKPVLTSNKSALAAFVEAEVLNACWYLKGSKHLKVSKRWKEAFPESLPSVF